MKSFVLLQLQGYTCAQLTESRWLYKDTSGNPIELQIKYQGGCELRCVNPKCGGAANVKYIDVKDIDVKVGDVKDRNAKDEDDDKKSTVDEIKKLLRHF